MVDEELFNQIKEGSFFDEDYFNGEVKSNYGSYLEYPAFKDLANKIFHLWLPKRIIDVGCAKGFMVNWWCRLGAEAYGIDISEWAVNNAPNEIKDCIFKGDIRDIKFPDRFFDVVVSFETLEHIFAEDIDKAISELYRVCNGICVISTPGSTNPAEKDLSHISIHSDEFWIDRFRRAGFQFLSKKESLGLDKIKKSEEDGYWTTNNIFVFKRVK